MYASDAANRVMATVTLEQASGRQLLAEYFGTFPDMTPKPEPDPVEQQVEAGGES
jgi:hypothetical protein